MHKAQEAHHCENTFLPIACEQRATAPTFRSTPPMYDGLAAAFMAFDDDDDYEGI
jgi:hypothetical protein